MFSKLFILLLGLIFVVRVAHALLSPAQLARNLSGRITIKGVLQAQPRTTSKAQIFTMGGIEVVKARFPEISYGDNIEITGTISYSEEKAKMLFPHTKVLENPNKGDIVLKAFKFKRSLINTIQKLLPEPEAGLMSGILLGAKSGLTASFKQSIQNTGLTHVVVASGANLTFVSGLIFFLTLLILGRHWANLAAIPVIWLYAFITGFEAAVVRAAIMVSFIYVARFFGRDAGSWRGLVIAIYIMMLYDPFIIINLGFQLSIAAMSGIIISGGGLFKQTMAAQIATLPLIIGTFGRYGLLSLLTNILTLWAIPPIMVLGTVAAGTGLISTGVGRILIIPAQILLSYLVIIITTFGNLETWVLTLPRIDPTAILGIYLIMIAVYVQRRVAKSA